MKAYTLTAGCHQTGPLVCSKRGSTCSWFIHTDARTHSPEGGQLTQGWGSLYPNRRPAQKLCVLAQPAACIPGATLLVCSGVVGVAVFAFRLGIVLPRSCLHNSAFPYTVGYYGVHVQAWSKEGPIGVGIRAVCRYAPLPSKQIACHDTRAAGPALLGWPSMSVGGHLPESPRGQRRAGAA